MNIAKFSNLLLLLIFSTQVYAQQEQVTSQSEISKLSDNKHYHVSITSKLEPITINIMHAWIVHIDDKNGQPVIDAEISVEGGMPEHDHGLPTQPQITQNLGEGNYLLEGMKFHMGGWWQVSFIINENNISDSVTFDLRL